MTIQKLWSVWCDEPGCPEEADFPATLNGREVGQALNALGWSAEPAFSETYCPRHFRKLASAPIEVRRKEIAE